IAVHDPACLCWVSRREALPRLALAHGALRLLPSMIAAAGFRIDEAHLCSTGHRRGTLPPARSHLIDALAIWWRAGRAPATDFVEGGIRDSVSMRIDARHTLTPPTNRPAMTPSRPATPQPSASGKRT